MIGKDEHDAKAGHEREEIQRRAERTARAVEDAVPTLGGRHWATTLARSLRCTRVRIIQIITEAQRAMACRIAISKDAELSS